MGSDPVDYANTLRTISDQLHRLPDPKEPPESLLRIINRGTEEEDWNNILEYFLSADEPHGFQTDVLDSFLTAVANHDGTNLIFNRYELPKVTIDKEQSPEGNIPDLIIRSPNKWFICVELKVRAEEGSRQTEKYVEDDYIGNEDKEEYPPEGHHYLYISPKVAPNSNAEQFRDVSWEYIVDYLETVLESGQGQYPLKSTNQLSDFLDTVKTELNMTENPYIENQREKMELYFKHQDEIESLFDAVTDIRELHAENWSQKFLTDYEPKSWNDEWNVDSRAYGQIYHNEWRLDDNLSPTDDTEGPVRLEFRHLINKDESFLEGEVTFRLTWPHSSDYKEQFYDLFTSDEWKKQLKPLLDERNIDFGGGPKRYTEKIYPVDQFELPESYFVTLREAFEEHQELEGILTKILHEAIGRVEGEM